jgi:hypothetical protein
VVDVVSHVADRYVRALDDDDLLKTIIDLIHERTGRVVPAAHARAVAESILSGARKRPASVTAYLRAAIRNERDPKGRFLPPDPKQPPQPQCGECNHYRRLEDADGNDLGPCPTCNPAAKKRVTAS